MIKYNGILKANPLKMEKEHKQLLAKKQYLQNKINIALGAGFSTANYEEELKNIAIKINFYEKFL